MEIQYVDIPILFVVYLLIYYRVVYNWQSVLAKLLILPQIIAGIQPYNFINTKLDKQFMAEQK